MSIYPSGTHVTVTGITATAINGNVSARNIFRTSTQADFLYCKAIITSGTSVNSGAFETTNYGSVKNCIVDGTDGTCTYGIELLANGATGHENLVVGCTTGFYLNGTSSFVGCVAANCVTGVTCAGANSSICRNFTAYNCTTFASLAENYPVSFLECIAQSCSTVFSLSAINSYLNLRNFFYDDVTTFYAGAYSTQYYLWNTPTDVGAQILVDPSNGNYQVKPSLSALVNLSVPRNENTTDYLQAGLTQQVVAGGGGSTASVVIL